MILNKKICVTAAGCAAPHSPDIKHLEKLLRTGINTNPPEQLDASEKKFTEIEEAAKKRLPSMIRRRMSRLSTMVCLSIEECITNASIDTESLRDEIGFVLGTGYGELDTTARIFFAGISEKMSPTLFHNSVHNAPLGYGGIITGIKGPSIAVSDGYISGEVAIINGAELICDGVANIVIAGGGDEIYHFPLFIDPVRKENPGEGSGFLVLEDASFAFKRGKKPLCNISGWSCISNKGNGANLQDRIDAFCRALESASGKISCVPVVFAQFLKGSKEEEVIVAATDKVFGRNTILWSSGEFFGLFPASGAIRCVIALVAISSRFVPAGWRYVENSISLKSTDTSDIKNVVVAGTDFEGDAVAIAFSSME